jgi:hypothetical protein
MFIGGGSVWSYLVVFMPSKQPCAFEILEEIQTNTYELNNWGNLIKNNCSIGDEDVFIIEPFCFSYLGP